jgi:hypothetical protein
MAREILSKRNYFESPDSAISRFPMTLMKSMASLHQGKFGNLIFFIIIIIHQQGLFKLAVQLRNFFNSVIYNTATGYVLLVYLTNI